jgi:hypothetical protein
VAAARDQEVLRMSEVKQFVRIVRTEDGGSAFEDDDLRLDAQQIASGFAPTPVA